MPGEVSTETGNHGGAPAPWPSLKFLRSYRTLSRADRKIYKTLISEFDFTYYAEINRDLVGNIDLLKHYITVGWKEGRDPTAWFSTISYLRNYSDVSEAGINPFYHYIAFGRAEGRGARPSYAEPLPEGRAGLKKVVAIFSRSKENERALEGTGFYTPALLPMFSAADYRFATREELHSQQACLHHFVLRGCDELVPLSFEFEFDPTFYRGYAGLSNRLTAAEAYKHWLIEGVRKGLPPNSGRLLRSLGFDDFDYDSFDVEMYLASNPRVADKTNNYWRCLEHFVREGAVGGVGGCPLSVRTVTLYATAAEYAATHGKTRHALKIYELLSAKFPNDPRFLMNYANLLFREGQRSAPAELYRQVIAMGDAQIYAHLNLAICLFEIGLKREAIQAIDVGINAFPEDYGLRLRRRQWLSREFEESQSLATAYARVGRRSEVHQIMSAAGAILSAAWEPTNLATRQQRDVSKVAIFADVNLPQCRFYRVDQKLEQFSEAGIKAEVFRFLEDFDLLASRIYEFDAIIFYRVPGWNEVFELISTARQIGIPTFYEVDDLVFDVEYFPEPFEQYDGLIDNATHAELMVGAEAYKAAMKACDYGIASTLTLARHMESVVRSGRVFVHQNALGLVHLAAMRQERKLRRDHHVTLFFGSGTKAHKRDFLELAAPALARLFTKYGHRIRLRMIGFQRIPQILVAFERYIKCDEAEWDIQKYWHILSRCDVNLAVLSRSESTDCKSEIKWLEAGMLGIPSVVSRNPTHEACIDEGVTGLLAATSDEWYVALDELIASSELRKKIGFAARKAIMAHYAPTVMASNLTRIMQEIQTPGVALLPRRKRILIVNVFYAPQAIGGATRVVLDNVRELTSRYDDAFEIEVFASISGSPEGYRVRSHLYEGVRITTVTTPPEVDIDSKALDSRMERIFAAFVAARQPDLIHFHCIQRLTASVIVVAQRTSVPYLVTVHDGWWISPRQFLVDEFGRIQTYPANSRDCVRRYGAEAAARAKVLREALEGAKYILAVSAAFGRIYREAGFVNVRTVPNGVSALPPVQRIPSSDGRVRVGYLGGLELHKGYPLVRAAFVYGRYPNLSLTIIDHTQDQGKVRRETWGETSVTFVGRRPQADVGLIYGVLDVLLAPSIWPESYGLVAREALHYGLWVIASDRGAIGEDIVEGQNGFIINVDTVKDLREILEKINADPARYTAPPSVATQLRTSAEQAEDLAQIYNMIFNSVNKLEPRRQDRGEYDSVMKL